MEDEIKKLKSEIKVLSEDLTIALNCLRFYGNHKNWVVTQRRDEIDRTTSYSSDIAEDDGQKARITIDAILKVRKHKKFLEQSKYTYTDEQLMLMGYRIVMLFDESFVIALSPKRKGELFTFAGDSFNFGTDLSVIIPFETQQLARVAVSNYINRRALIIKNKK